MLAKYRQPATANRRAAAFAGLQILAIDSMRTLIMA
jgi:hypothetical protein